MKGRVVVPRRGAAKAAPVEGEPPAAPRERTSKKMASRGTAARGKVVPKDDPGVVDASEPTEVPTSADRSHTGDAPGPSPTPRQAAEWMEQAGPPPVSVLASDVARGPVRAPIRLETLLTSPHGFALCPSAGAPDRRATPLQLAICRIADGEPLGNLVDHPDVLFALGGQDAVAALEFPRAPPKELYILAAVRCAKSLISAAVTVRASQTVDLSAIRAAGETPRISMLSVSRDLALPLYDHMVGAVNASKVLSKLVVGDPSINRKTGEGSIEFRHPSGGLIEARLVAQKVTGVQLAARWSAGAVFDEFPRMMGQESGVGINVDDARDVLLARMLPGSLILYIGSIFAARGPAYKAIKTFWGSPHNDTVCIRAQGPQMNPEWWTPGRVAYMKATSPAAYKRDCLAEFADDPAQSISGAALERGQRKEPLVLAPKPGWHYVAAIDPATRGNAWTLIIVTRRPPVAVPGVGIDFIEGKLTVALAAQWIPREQGGELDAGKVFREIKQLITPYRIGQVGTDGWKGSILRPVADIHGIDLCVEEDWQGDKRTTAYRTLIGLIMNGQLELPPDPVVLADLLCVHQYPTQMGMAIELVRSGDRHADYASALAVAMLYPVSAPDVQPTDPRAMRDNGQRELVAAMRHNELSSYQDPPEGWLSDGGR